MKEIGDFLNSINTSKDAWVYLLFSFIGLLTNITLNTISEKRWPKWYDLYQLLGWLPFVSGVAVLADNNPWVSLGIGIAPERVYKLIKSQGLSFDVSKKGQIVIGIKKPKELETPATESDDDTST